MSSKCSRCVYGKARYSEETGYDYFCSLPDGNDINDCMLGTKDFFKGCDEETRMFMVPFCEKCGHLIKEKIGIDRSERAIPYDSVISYRQYHDYVYPQVCPNCKAHFTAITVPTEESLYDGGYDAKKYLSGGTHFKNQSDVSEEEITELRKRYDDLKEQYENCKKDLAKWRKMYYKMYYKI